ncbi:Lrp/AsnC ligand binding domain-containing protein [Streptomyces sp. NPDC093272]|uniref:Lrp/AsnC ligand binding domain-containing protein n=1 Tax=Streptomyces sp. NPDC093272 TaxID=3154981 RepID=UPI003411FA4C
MPRRRGQRCRTPCRGVPGTPPPCLFRRLYGRPDYFIRVAVADRAAYEAFLTGRLSGLPAVLRLTSHLTMKKIKAED